MGKESGQRSLHRYGVSCGAMQGQRSLDRDARRVRFLNTAVRNSSVLRMALIRLCTDGTAREMGRKVVGIYWDTEKFYDSISPLLVMEEMVASGFEPVSLAISMQLLLAPRLRRDGH